MYTQQLTQLELSLYRSIVENRDYDIDRFEYFDNNFVKNRHAKMQANMQQLHKLKQIPYMKQRSAEWYEARKSRLTASDLEDAIKVNNLRLAKKKAEVIKDTTNYAIIPPLKWGTMFEPMAIRCYSQERDNIEIADFGLLLDDTLEHFGASPDGINSMGVMVEIKCPYTREIIDDSIPSKYYMQMQGQLAVCKLDECDYIECDFKTFESVHIYIDIMFNEHNNSRLYHGVIAEYMNQNNEYQYLYSGANLTAQEAYDDIKKQMQNIDTNLCFKKLTPWRLEKINVQRVQFDEELWKATVPKIEQFWNKVEECKSLPVEEVVAKRKITFIEEED